MLLTKITEYGSLGTNILVEEIICGSMCFKASNEMKVNPIHLSLKFRDITSELSNAVCIYFMFYLNSGDENWLADILEKEEASERLLRYSFSRIKFPLGSYVHVCSINESFNALLEIGERSSATGVGGRKLHPGLWKIPPRAFEKSHPGLGAHPGFWKIPPRL